MAVEQYTRALWNSKGHKAHCRKRESSTVNGLPLHHVLKAHTENTDKASVVCRLPEVCMPSRGSCMPRGGASSILQTGTMCTRDRGNTYWRCRKKTYWTQSNEFTEEWLPCPCTPCEDKQSLLLPLLTSTSMSLGYLFHQKNHNLCHEDKWATTGGVFHV